MLSKITKYIISIGLVVAVMSGCDIRHLNVVSQDSTTPEPVAIEEFTEAEIPFDHIIRVRVGWLGTPLKGVDVEFATTDVSQSENDSVIIKNRSVKTDSKGYASTEVTFTEPGTHFIEASIVFGKLISSVLFKFDVKEFPKEDLVTDGSIEDDPVIDDPVIDDLVTEEVQETTAEVELKDPGQTGTIPDTYNDGGIDSDPKGGELNSEGGELNSEGSELNSEGGELNSEGGELNSGGSELNSEGGTEGDNEDIGGGTQDPVIEVTDSNGDVNKVKLSLAEVPDNVAPGQSVWVVFKYGGTNVGVIHEDYVLVDRNGSRDPDNTDREKRIYFLGSTGLASNNQLTPTQLEDFKAYEDVQENVRWSSVDSVLRRMTST